MFEFGGHGQNHRPQGVAGGADRVGSLLRVSALMAPSATRTVAGLDLKLGNDRDNRRQVGLVLDDGVAFDEFRGTVGTGAARHFDNAVDALGRRNRTVGCRVAFATPRFLLPLLEFLDAETGPPDDWTRAVRWRVPRRGAACLAPIR